MSVRVVWACPRSSRRVCATCSSCPVPRRACRGPTSRSPRAATAPARSAPSRRSAASSGRARRSRSRPRRAAWSRRASPSSCSWRRTSPGTGATPASPARSPRCCAASTPSRPTASQRVRLLYLYPSEVRDPLVSTMLELPTVVPYFDLSLQHADAQLLRRMKRWGSGDRFLTAIDSIRAQEPDAAFRSSFIVGFPGETEREHDELLAFLEAASLDWAGFFPFSPEDGTPAADAARRGRPRPRVRVAARVRSGAGADHARGARRAGRARRSRSSSTRSTTDDGSASIGRTHREAPEIDGIVRLHADFARPGRAGARARHRGDRSRSRGQVAREAAAQPGAP